MTRLIRTTSLAGFVVAAAVAGAACQKNTSEADATRDHHPKPEGRLQVDQSAVLPVDVKAGVQREYPGAAVLNVNKRTYDDRVVRYEVHLRTKDGREVTRLFNADGKPSAEGAAGMK